MNRRIFILGILILLVATPGFAWLSGWDYRKPINVTAGTNLTAYALPINVTYDAHMEVDFSDVRFTDTSDVLLDIWGMHIQNSTYAYYFVNGTYTNLNNTQLYVYYGNTGQANVSNGTDTFSAFDDFLGVALSGSWTEPVGSVVVSDGSVKIDGTDELNYTTMFGLNYALGIRQKSDEQDWTSGFGSDNNFAFDKPGVSIINSDGEDDGNFTMLGYRTHGGATKTDEYLVAPDTRNYFIVEMRRASATKVEYMVNQISQLNRSTNIPGNALSIYFQEYGQASTTTVDWIYVRKYSDPDPTYVFGAEEVTPTAIFTYTPTYPHVSEELNFVGVWTSGNYTQFWWNFSTANQTFYTELNYTSFAGYATAGSKNVTLIAYDADGASNATYSEMITVYANISKVVVDISNYLPFIFKEGTTTINYTATGGIPTVNSSWTITLPDATTNTSVVNQTSFTYAITQSDSHTAAVTVCDMGNDVCVSNSTQFNPWNVTSTTHLHTPYNATSDSLAEAFYGDSVSFVSDGVLSWGLAGETKQGTTTTWTLNSTNGYWSSCDYIHYNFTVNNSWGTYVSNQSFTAVVALYNISVGCIDYRTPYCFILAEIFDIDTGTQISEATNTYDYFLTTIDGYGHTNETTSIYTGANLNLSLCMNTTPIITALTLDGIIGYGAVNYTDSSYAFDIASMDFVTSCTYANGHRYKFYTVSNTTTTYDTTFIIKQGGAALPDALVKIQAPVDDNWVVIMSGVTSANGKVTFPLEQCYTYYKIIVEQAGETLHESAVTCLMATECSASAGTCERIIDVDITVQEWYSVQAGIGSSCEYDSTNSYLKCTVSDTSGKGLSSELNVYMLTSNTPLCTETETSTTTTLICSTVGWLSGPYKFNLKVTTADNTYVINSGGFTIGSETTLGTEGPIVALAVLITLIFAVAKTNPVVLTVTATLGFVLLGVLKLTAISYTVTGWIVAMGLVAIIRGLSK